MTDTATPTEPSETLRAQAWTAWEQGVGLSPELISAIVWNGGDILSKRAVVERMRRRGFTATELRFSHDDVATAFGLGADGRAA